MKKRIFADIGIFLMLIILPWWVWVLAVVVGIVFFPLFWESIVFTALAEMLYAPHVSIGRLAWMACIPAVLVMVVYLLRPRMRLTSS